MLLKVVLIVLACIYLAINLLTAKLMSVKKMQHDFVEGQCLVGKILANIFYAPAWFLKALRFIVTAAIA